MRPIRIRRTGRRWRPSSPSTTRVVRPAARSISCWNSTGSEHLGSPPRPRVVAALPRLEAPIGSDNGTSVNSGRRRSSRSRAASTTDVMLAGAGRMVAELLAGTTAQRGSGTTRPSRRPAPVLQRHRPAARFLGGLSPRGGQPRESRRCGSRASGAYSRMAKRWLRTSCCGRRPVPLECGFRCQRSSKTDKFLTLIDLIGSGTRFSVDLDVGGREMAVGSVGNRVLGGFPSSLWARSLRPWGATASTAPALAARALAGWSLTVPHARGLSWYLVRQLRGGVVDPGL